jgi:pyruvate formate lyase activating enzyme
VGCGACVEACPYEAKELAKKTKTSRTVRVRIDGEALEVPERITVLKALEIAGYSVSPLPGADIHAPCRTGGCWSCSVVVDGELKPSCITPAREGMKITTDPSHFESRRIITGFHGHPVGGVGTPWQLKRSFGYIEVAGFAHGCILRCPTCQNWEITYSSIEEPFTPNEAARVMTHVRRECGVDRMAISGGEPTLNRRWLLEYLRRLRELNPDAKARLHVDTNAVLLTPEYVDELVEAGMTDVGIDVKALELSTFMLVTGLQDEKLAKQLLKTEWQAVKYVLDRYWGKVFIGVGIPYNPKLISLEEVRAVGERLAGWEPSVQVCALDYRPEFRRRDITKPSYGEMVEVKHVLNDAGLRCVICQTERGHVGPD